MVAKVIGSMGGVFNSTPFIFLTDTFTGEFLCGGEVGRGYFLGNDISVSHNNGITGCLKKSPIEKTSMGYALIYGDACIWTV
jgi:hypothetical protein